MSLKEHLLIIGIFILFIIFISYPLILKIGFSVFNPPWDPLIFSWMNFSNKDQKNYYYFNSAYSFRNFYSPCFFKKFC